MVVGALTLCALLHSVCDFKYAYMNKQHSLIWKLMLYEFQLANNDMEASKNIFLQKVKVQSIREQQPNSWRKFAWVARTSTFRPVGLKPWISRPLSKLSWQNWQVALAEYKVSSASYSPVWFVMFMTLAKTPRTTELCLTLPKYCKTFDSFLYFEKRQSLISNITFTFKMP